MTNVHKGNNANSKGKHRKPWQTPPFSFLSKRKEDNYEATIEDGDISPLQAIIDVGPDINHEDMVVTIEEMMKALHGNFSPRKKNEGKISLLCSGIQTYKVGHGTMHRDPDKRKKELFPNCFLSRSNKEKNKRDKLIETLVSGSLLEAILN